MVVLPSLVVVGLQKIVILPVSYAVNIRDSLLLIMRFDHYYPCAILHESIVYELRCKLRKEREFNSDTQ